MVMAPRAGEPGYVFALLVSCAFFMVCSAGMLVINKLVLRRFVGLPITIVMVQMAFTALCLVVTPCGVHFGSARDVLRWSMTIPFLFTLMLASSMLALDHASMGAIIVVRNVAPIVTMVIERLFQERIEVNVGVVCSLVYVVGGVALYTSHDVHFSVIGMLYMLLKRRSTRRTGYEPFELRLRFGEAGLAEVARSRAAFEGRRSNRTTSELLSEIQGVSRGAAPLVGGRPWYLRST